jgi:hypothetical protein
MRVGAAETEAAHRGVIAVGGQLQRFGQQPEPVLGQPQPNVLRIGIPARRHDTVVQGERDLDQTGDARRALGVAEVVLDRADRAGLGPRHAVHVAERLDLDHVAQHRAGTVRLHERDLRGVHARSPVRLGDHRLL